MQVNLYDSANKFKKLAHRGVDFDWYKSEESLEKKFVVLGSNIIYDNGLGRIQIYSWDKTEDALIINKK